MSGKISGNGGLGEIFNRLRSKAEAAVETSIPEATVNAKAKGDQFISSSVSTPSTLTDLNSVEVMGPAARSLVKGAKDLNDFIQKMIGNDFPNLVLSPVQTVKLSTYIRDNLALTGMNDENFQALQQSLK